MDKLVDRTFRRLVADYLTGLADWRRARYQDDLRDQRNLHSAAAIGEFAGYLAGLPDADPRLNELERLWLRGQEIEVGQQAAYEIGRFRFFSMETTLDAFLDQVVALARADRNEHGRFGGKQVPGDDGIEKLWDE